MYTKFAPGLFLEKAELDRFRKSLDEKGFRQFLLDNTLTFGLVDRQYFTEQRAVVNQFNNGKVTPGVGLTISHEPIEAINNSGLTIYRKATSNIAVPADSTWYWVKIKHEYTSMELGNFSIDASGNLVGDTSAELTTILRGQPYFPARVKFLNSAHNTIEYDVLEVIDDQNAILQGFFTPESDLMLSVVGTFAPDAVPTEDEKNIFQYDGCTLTLVEETGAPGDEPAKISGEEFYLARVKNDGADMYVQDKRTEVWTTRANYYLSNVDKTVNNAFGVERIRYDHPNSTRAYNIIDISWGIKSENFSISSELNQVTLSGGSGGRYKDISYAATGDFDGWLLYWEDGSYSTVATSTSSSGGQVNLKLDRLDIDKVSDDGGVTINPGTLILVPNAEEIEIELIPWAQDSVDHVTPVAGQPTTAREVFSFPIADQSGLCRALAYADTCQYGIRYRYKKNNEYSASLNMLADTTHGLYTEKAFDSNGDLLGVVSTNSYAQNVAGGYIKLYTSNQIILTIKDDAYVNQIAAIDLGDLLGTNTFALATSPNDTTLTVGVSKQYQYISGPAFTLNNTKRIVLADGLVNGNYFIIHINQELTLDGKVFSIVDSGYSALKEFTTEEMHFIENSEEGLYIRATWNGASWIIAKMNNIPAVEISGLSYPNRTSIASTAVTQIAAYAPFPHRSGKVEVNFSSHIAPTNGGGGTYYVITYRIKKDGVVIHNGNQTVENDGAAHLVSISAFISSYTAGSTLEVEAITDIPATVFVANTTFTAKIY